MVRKQGKEYGTLWQALTAFSVFRIIILSQYHFPVMVLFLLFYEVLS